jgi:hypothetical protein
MPNHRRILAIILPLIFFFLILFLFGRSENAIVSLITTSIAGLIALYLTSLGIKKLFNKSYLWILISTYSFKILLGIAHWLMFIQPDYFTGTGNINFLYDYTQLHIITSVAADSRIHNGFFSMVYHPLFLQSKDSIFQYLLSTLYYFTGNYALNYCAFNAFISTLTAVIVFHLYSLIDKELRNDRFVLLLACLFPMNLIASALMRDIAGQFFIAFGVLLLSLKYKTKLGKFISISFSMILMSLQRAIYVLIPVFSYIFVKIKKDKILLFFSFILITTLLLNTIKYFPFLERFSGYALNPQFDITKIITFLLLPLRLLRALIGPIPWTNVFSNSMESTYLSSAYLQSVFNLTVLFLLIPGYLKGKYQIGMIEIIVLLFLITGIATPDIHTFYFSTAFIFLIPQISKYKATFYKTMFRVIIFYFVLNVLYIGLGFVGKGIGQNF